MNSVPLTRKAWRRIQYDQTKRLHKLIRNNVKDKDIKPEVLDCIQKGADISRHFKGSYPILIVAIIYEYEQDLIKILYNEYPNAVNFCRYMWTYKWYGEQIYIKEDIHWVMSENFGNIVHGPVTENSLKIFAKLKQYSKITKTVFDYTLCIKIGYYDRPCFLDE